MQIISEKSYEERHILHNSITELKRTVGQLTDEGWSENTRSSITGRGLVRHSVSDVSAFKEEYPDITVHTDEPGFLSYGNYVYYTVHTRELSKEVI